jgi:hypothetical protein
MAHIYFIYIYKSLISKCVLRLKTFVLNTYYKFTGQHLFTYYVSTENEER